MFTACQFRRSSIRPTDKIEPPERNAAVAHREGAFALAAQIIRIRLKSSNWIKLKRATYTANATGALAHTILYVYTIRANKVASVLFFRRRVFVVCVCDGMPSNVRWAAAI